MKSIEKSVLIWFSAEEMYALVVGVERYPEFLPWCDHTQVLQQREQGMDAEIGIAFGGIRQAFVTRNQHLPGREVTMQLVRGPFSKLHGVWRFIPLGDGGQRACRVELSLNYGFDSGALGAVVGPVFDRIAGSLIDAFVKRAEQLYGEDLS